MNIEVLKNFLKLARVLNFTKASQEAFIAQPALSKQIKQLESELSVSLFERNRRNVVLTPAGEYFKTEVEQLIAQLNHSIEQARLLDKGEAGLVRVGYTHSAMQSFLPALIKDLNAQFPLIRVVLKEMTNTRQVQELMSREIDISISPNPSIGTGMRSKVLVKENFALVLPKDHPVDRSNFKGLSAFRNEPFILPSITEGEMYVGLVHSICVDAGFMPKVVHETAFANSGIRLVEAGMGITIEPISSMHGYDNIKFIELDQVRQKVEMTMLWQADFEKSFPKIIQTLTDFSQL